MDDEAIEHTESLTISLTNPQPPDAVLSLGSTTIIIINDDFRKFLFCFTTFAIETLCMCAPSTAHIRFEQERYTTSEAAGSIDVCITVLTGPVIDSLTVAIEMNSTKVQNPRRRNICYVIIHVYVENCRKIHVLSQ